MHTNNIHHNNTVCVTVRAEGGSRDKDNPIEDFDTIQDDEDTEVCTKPYTHNT